MADEDRASESLDQFPREVQDDVEGLAWLGYLEDSFEAYGHHFVIRTLKGDEELFAGILTKEYQDTLSQAKAWAWANAALCLVAVDHDRSFLEPVATDSLTNARARFDWLTSKWHWILGNFIFQRLLYLNARMLRAANAVQDLSKRSPEKSSSLPDSSTDSDDSKRREILDLVEE
jgi:hypothetical protein